MNFTILTIALGSILVDYSRSSNENWEEKNKKHTMSNKAPTKLAEHLHVLQEPMWMAKYTLVLQDKENILNKSICILNAGVGVLPIIAARTGAKMVYAVEDSALAETMQDLIATNGDDLKNKISIVKNVDEIKEKVDILLTTPMGMLCLHGNYLSYLVDARDKVLKENGIIIPRSLKLITSTLTDEKTNLYLKEQSSFWEDQHFFGVDLSCEAKTAIMQTFAQTLTGRILEESIMSVKPSSYEIDLTTIAKESVEEFTISANFKTAFNGMIHGIGAWFELDLGLRQCKIQSGPSTDDSQWYTCRFLLPKPMLVHANDDVEGTLKFQLNKLDSYNITIDLQNSSKGIRSRHLYPMNHYITHGMNNWDNSNNNNNVNGGGWHFCDQNNANIGPVSRTQIIEMLRAGKLHQGSYVWKQGFGDNWTPISQINELKI